MPGVLAVITAETLKTVNLAWMPTLAGDVQMVLADGKVLFQNQEVAFVVATDRYAADDGINKVVVEYEPLPVVIDRSPLSTTYDSPSSSARLSFAASVVEPSQRSSMPPRWAPRAS